MLPSMWTPTLSAVPGVQQEHKEFESLSVFTLSFFFINGLIISCDPVQVPQYLGASVSSYNEAECIEVGENQINEYVRWAENSGSG